MEKEISRQQQEPMNGSHLENLKYIKIVPSGKQDRKINKMWSQGSKTPGERLRIDISSIKGESFGNSRLWALIVDDFTGYSIEVLLKIKGYMSYFGP